MKKQTLNATQMEILKGILRTTQAGLKKTMEEYLISQYGEKNVIIEKEYVIALGTTPIGLVAHMDTVHTNQPVNIFFDEQEEVMWSPQGLGADDRAGVFSILEIIERGYRPTVILTTDEEVGGIGASAVAADFDKAPVDLNFLIELDRQGSNDAVYYDCDNPLFEEYITRFGFVTDIGSFSDICFICPTWGIAGVNLSIGYVNEHSLGEHLRVKDMMCTIDRVCAILDSVTDCDIFDFIPLKTAYKWDLSSFSNLTTPSETDEICWHCMEMYDQTMIVRTENGEETYCIDCYDKIMDFCELCGKEFKNYHKHEINQCPTCLSNKNMI